MLGGKLVIAITCLLASAPVAARGRLVHMLDGRQGLDVAAVSSLAQDTHGFIWIGTHGGLSRFDGQEIRRIAPEILVTKTQWIRAAPDGSVFVVSAAGGVHRVVDERAAPVAGPDGKPLGGIDDLWVDANGALWTVGADHAVRRRDHAGTWTEPAGKLEGASRVRGGADGTMYLASDTTVWRVNGSRTVVVATAKQIVDILPEDDGSVHVLQRDGHLLQAVDGKMTEVFYLDTRALALARRGRVIWAVYDHFLAAVTPGAPTEVLGRDMGIMSGSSILVDREGSLWVGTMAGLEHFPEPDTAVWDTPDGLLPSPRYLVETAEGIWVPTWSGLSRIDRKTGRAENMHRDVRGGVCLDGAGRLWGAEPNRFLVRIDGEFVEYPAPGGILPNPCDTGPTGRVWFAFRDGIHATRATGAPEHVATRPPGVDYIDNVFEDRRGRVWISDRDLVCHAMLDHPITDASWRCQRLDGAVVVNDFEETEAGTLWAATEQLGVVRWDDASQRWQPIAASLALASRVITGLTPSPRGGTWVLGHGVAIRVRERSDLAGGWQVVEAPSAWNGLPVVTASETLETSDGALWLTGLGVYEIPAHARDQVPRTPIVRVTELHVDGVRIELQSVLDVRHGAQIQINFAALSFRDPALVRYRVRFGRDAAWSAPFRQPMLQLAELAPGNHTFEVSVSLDGSVWSDPTKLVFDVDRPWWREPWVIALFVAAVLAVGYLAHRVRVGMQLRLERQRAHIAMDLHDEMGSGLGSIGILAELATNTEVSDAKRRDAAASIIEAAEDLGESLGDIVWSLRRGSNTLETLVAHILERGGRLLPEGAVELTTDLPSPVPPVALSLAVCRSLQLVCFEALHNAARHARAANVTFGLARVDRRKWRIWIEDDGVGLVGSKGRSDGLGLTSMRSRTLAIGAVLHIGARPSGDGTLVEVTFDPGTLERGREVL